MKSFKEWIAEKEIDQQEGVLDTVMDLERGWVKGGVMGLGGEIANKVKGILPKGKVAKKTKT